MKLENDFMARQYAEQIVDDGADTAALNATEPLAIRCGEWTEEVFEVVGLSTTTGWLMRGEVDRTMGPTG